MNITMRTVGKGVILDCSGRITVGAGTTTVRNAVRDAIRGGSKKIVLNLENVEYADSSGIGELVSSFTHVQSQGGKLVLLNLPKRIRDLLIITKLMPVFEVFSEEKTALAGC
ncbi:MAG: STAS domain-containing protein [Acidobacteriia bacterium]|nr:STAS domain-containing protein [Terriglobia bacterium]